MSLKSQYHSMVDDGVADDGVAVPWTTTLLQTVLCMLPHSLLFVFLSSFHSFGVRLV